MSKSVLYMSVSLDGFVCGPNETPDNGLGDNGGALHRWIPTILGEGRRLFEGIGAEPHAFELTRNVEGTGVTHLRYRVVA